MNCKLFVQFDQLAWSSFLFLSCDSVKILVLSEIKIPSIGLEPMTVKVNIFYTFLQSTCMSAGSYS